MRILKKLFIYPWFILSLWIQSKWELSIIVNCKQKDLEWHSSSSLHLIAFCFPSSISSCINIGRDEPTYIPIGDLYFCSLLKVAVHINHVFTLRIRSAGKLLVAVITFYSLWNKPGHLGLKCYSSVKVFDTLDYLVSYCQINRKLDFFFL